MNTPMYNPYAHASQVSVDVKHVKFSDRLLGYYDHAARTIYIASTLSLVYAACVLAHELIHAIYEDTAEEMRNPRYRQQAEKRCNHIAALNLMPETRLIDTLRRYEDPDSWYEAMCVMPWVLKTYLENLTPTQRAYLESKTGRDLSSVNIETPISWAVDDCGRLVEVEVPPHKLSPEENGDC